MAINVWLRRANRTARPAATAPAYAGAAAVTISRWWLLAAWLACVAVAIAAAFIGRKGQPLAYLIGGVALAIGLIITEPALHT